jgi:hypothetical protein
MDEEKVQRVPRIDRARVLIAFRKLGYSEDITRENISILRQMDFPFRRITLPNHPQISTELIRLYLMDLGIDFEVFYRLVQEVKP